MNISAEKKEKISEQIMAFLYSIAPKSAYTSHIAKEIARDEEFIKKILEDLKKKSLIVEIRKNKKGDNYSRRIRWKIADAAYLIYNEKQNSSLAF
jgi:hypothetical protein